MKVAINFSPIPKLNNTDIDCTEKSLSILGLDMLTYLNKKNRLPRLNSKANLRALSSRTGISIRATKKQIPPIQRQTKNPISRCNRL